MCVLVVSFAWNALPVQLHLMICSDLKPSSKAPSSTTTRLAPALTYLLHWKTEPTQLSSLEILWKNEIFHESHFSFHLLITSVLSPLTYLLLFLTVP